MPSTFVPEEGLPPPYPLQGDPTTRHSKAQARRLEFLSTSQIRYDLFRSRHEPELYCALPEDWRHRQLNGLSQVCPSWIIGSEPSGDVRHLGPDLKGLSAGEAMISGVRIRGPAEEVYHLIMS